MGDLTRTERNEIEQMKRDVAALKRLGVSGGLSLTRGPGGQMVIGGAPAASGFYAALTGGTTSPYSFAEVAGPALGSAAVSGGRTGTLNAYEQLTGLAAIPVAAVGAAGATVVWVYAGPTAQPWRFNCAKTAAGYASAASLTGSVGGGSGGGIYARITGNAAKRYSFVQVAVDASDAAVDVTGGVTGSTSAGYALDIGGGSAALHTPAPALVVLLVPNPLVAGTWLFGPISVCP